MTASKSRFTLFIEIPFRTRTTAITLTEVNAGELHKMFRPWPERTGIPQLHSCARELGTEHRCTAGLQIAQGETDSAEEKGTSKSIRVICACPDNAPDLSKPLEATSLAWTAFRPAA